jgi:hypothetical protein
MGVRAGTNLAREFWPSLKGIFHKKKVGGSGDSPATR